MKIIKKEMNITTSQRTLGCDMYGGRTNVSTHYHLMYQYLTYNIQSQNFPSGSIINLDEIKLFYKIYTNMDK